MLSDRFGRIHDYLRISVTDRCNLRCLYCMPEEGMEFVDSDTLLSYDDIVEVVETAAALGFRRLRITGGEPLVRPGLDQLIRRLKALPGIEEISLTTNGILLARQAQALKDAGLDRVNISLDTLDAARFRLHRQARRLGCGNGRHPGCFRGRSWAHQAELRPAQGNQRG